MRAGASKVDISPPPGLFMAGMGGDRAPASRCHDPLMARGLFLDDGRTRWLLVTADLIAFSAADHAKAKALIAAARPDLAGAMLTVACSHTHSGPATYRCDADSIRKLPQVDPGPWAAYMDGLAGQVAAAALQAAAVPVEARVGVGTGTADVNMNRWHYTAAGEALFIPGHRELAPNGTTDRDVTVLWVRDMRGGPIAVVYHYTMHAICVCLQSGEMTADFPGIVAREVEQEHGGTCLFVNGPEGDIHPVDFDRGFEAAERAAAAIVRAIDAGGRKMRCAAGARLATAERTVTAEVCDHADPSKPAPGWPARPMTVQAIGIAGTLGFVTAPGEPYVDVGLKIKAGSPFKRTALVSCANDFAGGEDGDRSHTAYFALRESYTRYRFEPTYTRPDFTFDTTDRYIAAALELLRAL